MSGLELLSSTGRRVSPTDGPKGMKALSGTALTVGERKRTNNTAPRPANPLTPHVLYIVQPFEQETRLCWSRHRHHAIDERHTPDGLKVAVHQYACAAIGQGRELQL